MWMSPVTKPPRVNPSFRWSAASRSACAAGPLAGIHAFAGPPFRPLGGQPLAPGARDATNTPASDAGRVGRSATSPSHCPPSCRSSGRCYGRHCAGDWRALPSALTAMSYGLSFPRRVPCARPGRGSGTRPLGEAGALETLQTRRLRKPGVLDRSATLPSHCRSSGSCYCRHRAGDWRPLPSALTAMRHDVSFPRRVPCARPGRDSGARPLGEAGAVGCHFAQRLPSSLPSLSSRSARLVRRRRCGVCGTAWLAPPAPGSTRRAARAYVPRAC